MPRMPLHMEQSVKYFWEFESEEEMFSHLIGNYFGENPASKVDAIRAEKGKKGEIIARQLGLDGRQAVLEIGSGTGYIARAIAHKVRTLKCCDISKSFLNMAAKECYEHQNISFHHIQSACLPFVESGSIDAVYANNVFIHLNLYEIHNYFETLARVIKPRGRLWLDILNASTLAQGLSPLFLEMVGHYRKEPKGLPLLLSYVSREAVCGIAEHFGFRDISVPGDNPHWMLFERLPS